MEDKTILSSTGTGRALKAKQTPAAPGVLKPRHDTEYTENKMQNSGIFTTFNN